MFNTEEIYVQYIERAVYVVPKFVIVFLKLFGSTVLYTSVQYIYTQHQRIFLPEVW